jgi:hypothetical protein
MEQGFIDILKRMYKEQGLAALTEPDRFAKVFPDYEEDAYKRESALLRILMEAGAGKSIFEAADLPALKTGLVNYLADERSVAVDDAVWAVDTLASVLRKNTGKTVLGPSVVTPPPYDLLNSAMHSDYLALSKLNDKYHYYWRTKIGDDFKRSLMHFVEYHGAGYFDSPDAIKPIGALWFYWSLKEWNALMGFLRTGSTGDLELDEVISETLSRLRKWDAESWGPPGSAGLYINDRPGPVNLNYEERGEEPITFYSHRAASQMWPGTVTAVGALPIAKSDSILEKSMDYIRRHAQKDSRYTIILDKDEETAKRDFGVNAYGEVSVTIKGKTPVTITLYKDKYLEHTLPTDPQRPFHISNNCTLTIGENVGLVFVDEYR